MNTDTRTWFYFGIATLCYFLLCMSSGQLMRDAGIDPVIRTLVFVSLALIHSFVWIPRILGPQEPR